jgi:hypothetical protein
LITGWADSLAEALLRGDVHRGLSAQPWEEPVSPVALDPAGTACRYRLAGHAPLGVASLGQDELRAQFASEPVRCVEHELVEAGSLPWSTDAVEGSDPARLLSRLTLERRAGCTLTLLTHDPRAVAPIEACGGAGLQWNEHGSILSVPSWDDSRRESDRERPSWMSLSVVPADVPWQPCPVAAPHARSRTR